MIFSTPYVFIDMNILEDNIERMSNNLKKYGVKHRPHIKAHKSIKLLEKQLKAGAIGITVAKISEAEVMVKSSVKDILIAYTLVGEDKFVRLEKLLDYATFTVTIDNIDVALKLGNIATRKNTTIKVLLEIRSPANRGGIGSTKELISLAKQVNGIQGIILDGIFGYMGIRKDLSDEKSRELLARDEDNMLADAKEKLEMEGIKINTVSGGTSLTSKYAYCFKAITESRAGNYIFNDVNSVYLGASSYDNCALKVKSTVINIIDNSYAIIDAGSKTLTSDTKGDLGYGYIEKYSKCKVAKLNEEHGFVELNGEKMQIGECIDIIPFHSCVLPNLCDEIYTFRDGVYESTIKIDARGKCY